MFHDPTTGAGNDIEKATSTARKMVTEYGMSASLGPVRLGQAQASPYLGEFGSTRDYSEGVAESVDSEVRNLIEQAHNEAYAALVKNRAVLDRLAGELMEKETLDHLQIAEIFADVQKLPERRLWLSSGDRPVSDLPPIPVPESVRTDGLTAESAAASEPTEAAAPTPAPDTHEPPGPAGS